MPLPAGQTVPIATADGALPVYAVAPDGAPRGGVIVIQEAFGVTPHIEEVARRFAAAGYHALAPHLFHRTGDPVLSYTDREAIWPHLKDLRADDLLEDLDACIGQLASAPGLAARRVGVVGFCMGGSVAALAAGRRELGAAVSFYGGGVAEGRFGIPPLLDLAPGFATPWLGLYGGRDQGIPVEQAEALRAAAVAAAVPTDLVIYPEAGHGFHCDARPEAYDAAAAAGAWQRALDWLEPRLS